MRVIIKLVFSSSSQIFESIISKSKKDEISIKKRKDNFMNASNRKQIILNKYVNQQTLMKELHIGYDTLKMLRLNGLEVIIVGRQHLYDLEDVKNIFNQLKNDSLS